MNVLLMGGTGVMGKYLERILESEGNNVYVTSRSEHADRKNVVYLCGNARDKDFLDMIFLRYKEFDVIIDFMRYDVDEIKDAMEYLLSHTNHYIFLSSARVYSNSKELLTEQSPRLLNDCKNFFYKKSNEYAIAKAKEEDILWNSFRGNWTIVRPYITYSPKRIQLGSFEKNHWLRRAVEGKAVVIPAKIANKYTTLTYALDVAKVIARICYEKANGNVYQIATDEYIKWNNVCEIYADILEEYTGKRPRILVKGNPIIMAVLQNRFWQVKYDRMYDRRFSTQSVIDIMGEDFKFTKIRDGLKRTLDEFFSDKDEGGKINWVLEGYFDRLSGDKTQLKNIPGKKDRIMYLLVRYVFFFL